MAVTNIARKGDTDIFPFPVERYLFQDKKEEVLSLLVDMDREYGQSANPPIDCIKTCIPVGYTGFRWATQIDPLWNAFLLGNVLKIAGQIERKRIPVEENAVFSYRMNYDEDTGTLFNRDINWKAFYRHAGEVAAEKAKDKKFRILTYDISDFYNRIYHERLRDVLHAEADADGHTVNRIMEIVSRIAGGNSPYGLPVGGNASRILAEALLIRADNFMRNSDINFCRFVDDYVVFAESAEKAYGILNQCAGYFMNSMGLSLQKNKTTLMTAAEFSTHIKSVFDEIESEKDPARASILRLKLHVDKYSAMADEDLRDLREKIDGSALVRLLKSECRKTRINQMFGKQLVGTLPLLEEDDLSEAFEVLSVNFEKLFPVFPVIMHKAYHNLAKCDEATVSLFTGRVAELFENNSYIIQSDNNASYAVRVLSLGENRKAAEVLAHIYQRQSSGSDTSTHLLKSNIIYAMANLKNLPWLEERLREFPTLSSWERRALAVAAPMMEEKGASWRKVFRDYCTPSENLAGDWAQEQISVNPNWKLPL